MVESKIITPIWTSGKENMADMLTKTLAAPLLEKFVKAAGLTDSSTQQSSLAAAAAELRGRP